ncbi:serine protease inhibitor [Culex quinquefasciatus]|uniref:Serine protease inhibitor n=1 Tax=Culex quinquefasciatus TaxID=7176 RepID=B0WFR2_CULQU|nr:serine protease inhibitor [Culex quinquefasciatus]|eukprot:XP_001847546.1 serine protease inhibitor [Culex quinquefasciatus]
MKSALFFGKQIPVKECIEDKFLEEIEKLDFENDTESQRLYINNWVDNTTHGEITDLLIPGSITKNTKLAIANAAYFKGTWQSKFKPEETKNEIFYVSNERQEFVDMMHVEESFNHAPNEKLGCHILKLPYTGQDEASRVSMFTVLGRGMGKLFENSANFSGFSKKVQVGEVLVKFKITINEEGATVASATVEFSFRSSRPDDPAMFHCNHPFIFVI